MHYQPYLVLIGQLCLIVEMMLVANIKWPEPVSKSTRYPYNLLMLFQRGVGWAFDTLAKGSKKTVPPLLKAANSDRAVWIETRVQEAWNHPLWDSPRLHDPNVQAVLSWLSWLIIPELFYHEGGFKDSMIGPRGSFAHDSVIGSNWNRWRKEIIAQIDVLEKSRKEYVFRLISWAVKSTPKGGSEETRLVMLIGKVIQMTKTAVKELAIQIAKINGHPEAEELGVLLLKAVNNDFTIRMFRYLRAGLEDRKQPYLPLRALTDDSVLRDPTGSAAVVERREVSVVLPDCSSHEDFPALRCSTETIGGGLGREVQQRGVNDDFLLLRRRKPEAPPPVHCPDMQGCSMTEIIEDDEPKAASAPVNQRVAAPVESKLARQSVNSGNVRKVLSLNSSSSERSERRSVDRQTLLGLKRHSVFSHSELIRSARLQAKPAAEQALLAQDDLEKRLSEAMNDRMGENRASHVAHQ